MFPYKSFFERHPSIGLSLLISSIGGAVLIPKYLKWLSDKEQAYNDMLQDCDISQFFSLFMEEYKIVGVWDNILEEFKRCKREESFFYRFVDLRWLKGESVICLRVFFDTNCPTNGGYDERRVGFNKKQYLYYIKRFFHMNDAQFDIIWNRTLTYVEDINKKSNKEVDFYYFKAGTHPTLEPVIYVTEFVSRERVSGPDTFKKPDQYVPAEPVEGFTPDATKEHTL